MYNRAKTLFLPYSNYPFKKGSFANLKSKSFYKNLLIYKTPRRRKIIGFRGKPAREPNFSRRGLVKPI